MKRIAFFGTPDFSVRALESLLRTDSITVSVVISQPDRPRGRGQQLVPSPVKACALAHGLPVLTPESIKKIGPNFIDPSFHEGLASYGPFDGAVVIAFGQILPVWLLAYFHSLAINVHASLLPRWRGAAPIQRAVMAGDTKTGVCLMQMEAGLDTGPVYCRKEIPLTEEETSGILHERLANAGASLLSAHLVDILSGTISATPQPEEGVTYAKKIEKEEAKIDWSLPAAMLAPRIRGLSPFPGAFTFHKGKRIKILHAKVKSEHQNCHYPCGTIVDIASDSIIVQCGSDSCIGLTLLMVEGKSALDAASFVRGYPLLVSDQFE